MYEKPYNPYAKNLAIVKGYLKSGRVMTLGILNLLTAILGVVAAIFSAGFVSEIVNFAVAEVEKNYIIDPQLKSAIYQSTGNNTLNSVLSQIPTALITILVAVAFILMYVKSRNEDANASPRGGVTILYVLSVIVMVLAIIGVIFMVLGIIVLLWLVFGVADLNDLSAVQIGDYMIDLKQVIIPVLISVIVSLVITAFFMLFVSINRKRFYGSMRSSMASVELTRDGAKPYGVMCVLGTICAGFGLLSIPAEIIGMITLRLGSSAWIAVIISAVSQIVAFLTILFEAKLALGYAKYIDDKKYGYSKHASEPESTPAPYAPYAMGGSAAEKQANPYKDGGYNDGFGDSKKKAEPQPAAEAKLTCPACGAEVNGVSPFCGRCGHKLK